MTKDKEKPEQREPKKGAKVVGKIELPPEVVEDASTKKPMTAQEERKLLFRYIPRKVMPITDTAVIQTMKEAARIINQRIRDHAESLGIGDKQDYLFSAIGYAHGATQHRIEARNPDEGSSKEEVGQIFRQKISRAKKRIKECEIGDNTIFSLIFAWRMLVTTNDFERIGTSTAEQVADHFFKQGQAYEEEFAAIKRRYSGGGPSR